MTQPLLNDLARAMALFQAKAVHSAMQIPATITIDDRSVTATIEPPKGREEGV